MAERAIYDMFDEDKHVIRELPSMEKWLSVGVDYGTVNPFAALLVGVSVPDLDGQRRIYIASELRYDSRAERRQLTDSEYSERLTDHLRVHESCRGLLDKMAGYAWDERKAEKGDNAPSKVDDHSVDALRYALRTTQAEWLRLLEPVSVFKSLLTKALLAEAGRRMSWPRASSSEALRTGAASAWAPPMSPAGRCPVRRWAVGRLGQLA